MGLGNVALDCARVLLQPPERLGTTDIAPHALSELKQSSVEQVDIIGRRGIAQVQPTPAQKRAVWSLQSNVKLSYTSDKFHHCCMAKWQSSSHHSRSCSLHHGKYDWPLLKMPVSFFLDSHPPFQMVEELLSTYVQPLMLFSIAANRQPGNLEPA